MKGTLDELSTYNDKEKAKAMADILNDPEKMEIMPKMMRMGESALLYSKFDTVALDVENFKERAPLEKV